MNTGAHSYLKRLGISGLDGIYGIHGSHHARQEGWLHTPEAQVLECFWSPADLKDMLRLTERMIMGIVREQCRTSRLTWQSHTQMRWLAELYNDIAADDALADTTLATNDTVVIDLILPGSTRASSAGTGVTGVDFLALTSLEDAVEIARSVGVEIGRIIPIPVWRRRAAHSGRVSDPNLDPAHLCGGLPVRRVSLGETPSS